MAQQPLHALGEGAARRIEVAAQRAAQRLVHQLAVLDQALFERAEQAVAFLPDSRAVDGAACGLEREDADLERRERELLAVAAFGAFEERGDRFRIRDREV